jgi:methylenetetrahydrofolate reductase (NADPH)
MTPAARNGSRLERLLGSGHFVVTAEVVPPKSGDGRDVIRQTRQLVGYADAVNVTNNPTASAHMSAEAGVALVASAGVEPTLQATTRDRNRLAITSELLGAWALGARNVLCLSGDPLSVGDYPDAKPVFDLDVLELIRLLAGLRDDGRLLPGEVIERAPRYFVGAADSPLAAGYDFGRLDAKIDAGARFVQTQIVHDVDAFGEWAVTARERGVLERVYLMPGVAPLRSAKAATFMREKIPGIVISDEMVAELEQGGEEAGVRQCVEIVGKLRAIDGIRGVHVMGLGHEDAVTKVIDAAGLTPRPSA